MTAAPSVLVNTTSSAGRLPLVTPVTGSVGASVTGLDLRSEHSPEVRQLLVRALHEHGVLFVRFEGEIGPEEHRRFSRVFGELLESPFNKGDLPFVSVLDSEKLGTYSADRWHTDAPVLARPPGAAALRAILLPEVGGDTMWASMYAAYEALSPKMQRFLDGLEAIQSTETHPDAKKGLFKEHKSTVHPVVIRDPVTGKPALYVNSNYTQAIVGLSEQESATVLRLLFDHVNTPDFHVRLKWDIQTIAIWEERVTQHRVISDYVGRRIMHRTTLVGGALEPYGDIAR